MFCHSSERIIDSSGVPIVAVELYLMHLMAVRKARLFVKNPFKTIVRLFLNDQENAQFSKAKINIIMQMQYLSDWI